MMPTIDVRDTHAYPIMILLSFAAGLLVQYLLGRRRGMTRQTAGLTALACFLFPCAGALLLTWITSGGRSFGFSSLGGLVGMYVGGAVVAAAARLPQSLTARDITLVLPLMYSISKVGCLLAGCCGGRPWDGILSVTYLTEEGSRTVLAVPLLETICFLMIFLLWMWMHAKGWRYAVHIVFILAMLTKCGLDFARASHEGQLLSLTQILCLVLVLADGAVLVYRQIQRRRMPPFPL